MRARFSLLVMILATLGGLFWVAAAGNSVSGGPIATAQDLKSAIAAANPGDVLLLQPGDYGSIEIRNGQGITLKSADPQNPAIIGGLVVKGGRDIVFDDIRFDYTFQMSELKRAMQTINWPFQFLGAENVTVRNSRFDGDILPDGRKEEIGYPTGTGVYVRDCNKFTLENNTIYGFVRGIIVDRSSNTVIRGNDIFGIRLDAMNLVALTTLLIEGNHFHNFARALASGDHSDMIQFWTAGSTIPSTNITIRGNVMNSGGNYYTQSIFIRNELVDTGKAGREMYYRNLVIEDNVIINAHLHGITVGETDGLVIRNNTLIHNRLSDGPDNNPPLWIPIINVNEKALNVTIEDNIAPALNPRKTPGAWKVSGNLAIQDRNPGAPGWYEGIFANAISGSPSDLRNYAYLPDGPAGSGKVGAPGLAPKNIEAFAATFAVRAPQWPTTSAPSLVGKASASAGASAGASSGASAGAPAEKGARSAEGAGGIKAAFAVRADATFLNRFTFDAGESVAASGDLRFAWTFGSEKAEGKVVQRDFAQGGPQVVSLTVTQADGKTAEARGTIIVPSAVQLEWDPKLGKMLGQTKEGLAPLVDLPVTDGEGGAKAFVVSQAPVALPPDVMEGFFGATDFSLSLRFRTVKGAGAVGEILRVQQSLALSITTIGAADLQVAVPGGKPVKIRTGPLRLHDGAWHDLEVRYDGKAGKVSLFVDGALKGAGQMRGATPPRRNWGLSFGNGFGQKSFSGTISALQLRSNEARFAR